MRPVQSNAECSRLKKELAISLIYTLSHPS